MKPTLILYLLFLPLCFLPAYTELKYPAAAVFALLLIWQYPIHWVKTDRILLIFLGFLFLSLIDMRNPSYAWLPLASWILLLLTTIGIRTYAQHHAAAILRLLQIILLVTIAYTLFMIITLYGSWMPEEGTKNILQMTIGNERGKTWSWLSQFPGPNWFRRGYGKNYNVTAVFPVLLSPVVLFHAYPKKWLNLTVKPLLILALLWIVNYFGSQLGMGLLLLFGLAALWTYIPFRYLWLSWGLGVLTVLLAGPWLMEIWEQTSGGLKNTNHSGRWAFDQLAIKISAQQWWNGLGLGAWYYGADPLANLGDGALRGKGGAGNTFPTFRAFIHNHNTKMLAEIGPLGFIFYMALPVWMGVQLLRKKIPTAQLKYALIFLGWYASAMTLRFAVGDDNEISEVQWLGWLAFGLCAAHADPITIPWNLRKLLLGVAALLVFFFTFNFFANHQQLKAINLAKNRNYAAAIAQLTAIYVPGLKTTINDVEPIQRHLARWYLAEGCPNEAAAAYQKAIDLLPFDPGLAQEYLQFIVDYQMIQKSDVD